MATKDSLTYSEKAGIEMLYRDIPVRSIEFNKDVAEKYNKYAEDLGLEPIASEIAYSRDFWIPSEYKNIDVESYFMKLAKTEEEQGRVVDELHEFKIRSMYPVLQLMIYISDTLKKNNCVWGIGRGSSVASYCLYLIGIHGIDSIKYALNIHEFLK